MGDSNINPTTIWTPTTGYLNTPGTTAGGYQYQPQVTSVYDVPGLLLPAPDCTQANAGAYVSSECVDKALAVQQQNFARTAAYNAGTLKLPAGTPPPAPPPSGPQPCVQPNFFKDGICVDPFSLKPVGNAMTQQQQYPGYVAPTPKAPAAIVPPVQTDPNYVAPSTGFFDEDLSVGGMSIPLWGLAAAGLAEYTGRLGQVREIP